MQGYKIVNKIKVLKIVAVISGIAAILQFIYPFFLRIMLRYMFNQDIGNLNTASSIGIIGSADGPTAIFVGRGSNIIYLVLKYGFAIICVISTMFIILLKKRKSKSRRTVDE